MRFYTNPAALQSLNYPYLLFNLADPSNRWLKHPFEHCILDSGVDSFFFVRRLNDYPPVFKESFVRRVKEATDKRGNDKLWVTIPDYPDDYQSGLTWESGKDNIDKTFDSIERYHSVDGITWVYPLQSRFLDRNRFVESCHKLKDEYNPKVVGVGTVCKTNDIGFIMFCMRKAREILGNNVWIHAFGPNKRSLPMLRFFANSFDSTAYYRYNGRMASGKKERTEAFLAWKKDFEEIVATPTLTTFLEAHQ